MKIYGFEDVGPSRGDMVAAEVDRSDLDYGPEMLAHELGWLACFTSFRAARAELVRRMAHEGADAELVNLVRASRAADVPVIDR